MARIIRDPEILGGKPVVEGTRMSVEHILELLSHGMSHSDIKKAHPILAIEDINAAVRYAIAALQNGNASEVSSGKRPR